MAITAISRDWGVDPSIVRITTTDDLATITTTGYLTAQEDNIELLQNGSFEWLDTDFILIYYADGEGFFVRDSANETFDEANPSSGLADTLQDGNIFVGNGVNVATGVAPSGDITLTNTGVFGIASGVIVNADINAAAAISYSKLAALPSGDLIVGSAANVPTVRAITGDVVISNTGVTAISAGVIVNTDINAAAAIDYSKLAALPSADILVGSAGNVATAVAMTGDVTIDNAGVTSIAAGAVTSYTMSGLLLKYAQVSISAVQWNGMYAAPKLILAAPGNNVLYVLDRLVLVMTYGSANYAAGGPVALQYDNTVNGAGALASNAEAAADFFAAASTSFQFIGNYGDTDGITPFSTSSNKGLYLSNTSGAFTTGDSTFIAHIWYRSIQIA